MISVVVIITPQGFLNVFVYFTLINERTCAFQQTLLPSLKYVVMTSVGLEVFILSCCIR